MEDRVIVGLENASPNYDVSLSDGDTTIGLKIVDQNGNKANTGVIRQPTDRNSVKTSSGETTYSDLDLPWGTIAQEAWSGGRGSKWFDQDKTKYMDAGGVNTQAGYILLGKQETYTKGNRSQEFTLPGSMDFVGIMPGSRAYLAVSFIAASAFSAKNIWLWIKRKGSPGTALTIELCADSSNTPGTVLATKTVTTATITDTLTVFHQFVLDSAQSLSSATRYWIKAYSANGTTDDHWEIGYNNAIGTTKESSAGTSWTDSSINIYHRVTDADVSHKRIFFNYKYLQYHIENTIGAAPKLYKNGDRGVADSNSGALTTLIDATKSWATNEYAGCVVWIVGGTGVAEDTPFRTIESNTSNSLTVSTAWTIPHDTTTEYVILGYDKWTEITGHGLTGPVTDIALCSGFVYFAQGDAINIRRYKWEQSAGAESTTWADDGTNKAHKLAVVRDAVQGLLVWKANNNGTAPSIARADAATSWANLTFGTAISINVSVGKINKIAEGGDPKELYIFLEGTVMKCVTDPSSSGTADVLDEIPLSEIRTTMNLRNGITAIMHNVYLYFNNRNSIEQFYSSDMVDMGPNKGDGLPSDRRGYVSFMLGYPGSIFTAVNGEASRTSSVLNLVVGNTSYHEEYRAPIAGYEIDNLAFQTIPGDTPDRLWISVGPDIVYLKFPSDDFNLMNDSNMRYRHEGHVISGYSTASLIDATKIYNSFKIWGEYLSEDDGQTAEIQYQVDEETEWSDADDIFTESPIQEVTIGGNLSVTGKRIRYRLILHTTDNTKTPQVKSIIQESVIRIIVKYQMTFTYLIKDAMVNSKGETTNVKAKEVQAILDAWAENFTPLYLRTNDPATDKKVVWLDPISMSNMKEHEVAYLGTIVINELRKSEAA